MEIGNLQNFPRTEGTVLREEKLTGELDEWIDREELLWKQRARTDWLKGVTEM